MVAGVGGCRGGRDEQVEHGGVLGHEEYSVGQCGGG